jgi:hypothetical protein
VEWKAIAEGRDPEWRILWEEGYDKNSRRLVEETVREGRGPEDPQLSAISLGYIARERRRLRFALALAPVLIALNIGWIYFMCVDGYSAQCWFWLGLLVVWIVAVPIRVVQLWRRWNSAERAVSAVLSRAQQGFDH